MIAIVYLLFMMVSVIFMDHIVNAYDKDRITERSAYLSFMGTALAMVGVTMYVVVYAIIRLWGAIS